MARGKRHRPARQAPARKIEVGRRVDGYRIERIITERPGVHVLADARVPGGDRVLLDLVSSSLPQDRELRRRMARLIPRRAGIDHPNVLRLLKSVEGGQRLHLKALPSDAVTLAERLRHGPLEPEAALMIAGQIAGALEAGRDKGVVHRALSPRAVFVVEGDEPQVLLTDFGICAPRGPACELRGAVDEAAYRSPEEVRGEAPEPPSNVYSLACILVECLTGETPYRYARPLLVLHAHLTEAPPALSERNPILPHELDAVVATAMEKDPRRRQPSAESFVRAAAEALGVEVAIPVVRAPKPKTAPAPAARPAPEPAAPAAAVRRRPAPASTPAPPGPRRAPARTSAPARTRSERRRDRPSRTGGRRRAIPRLAPLLGGLALFASAVAGFASGSSGSDGPGVSDSPTQVAAAAPTSVPQNVDNAVERLDVRRVAARRKLRAARRPRGQALAAQTLADAYGDAQARLAKDGIEGDSEARLADRLEAVEAAYRDLASAARSGSSKRWKAASKATQAREFDLELLLRNREWN
jgi:serine/threonine-protein kinase